MKEEKKDKIKIDRKFSIEKDKKVRIITGVDEKMPEEQFLQFYTNNNSKLRDLYNQRANLLKDLEKAKTVEQSDELDKFMENLEKADILLKEKGAKKVIVTVDEQITEVEGNLKASKEIYTKILNKRKEVDYIS